MWSNTTTEITLSKAVQAENWRGTVASAQRSGRAEESTQGASRKRQALFDTDGNVDSANIALEMCVHRSDGMR